MVRDTNADPATLKQQIVDPVREAAKYGDVTQPAERTVRSDALRALWKKEADGIDYSVEEGPDGSLVVTTESFRAEFALVEDQPCRVAEAVYTGDHSGQLGESERREVVPAPESLYTDLCRINSIKPVPKVPSEAL